MKKRGEKCRFYCTLLMCFVLLFCRQPTMGQAGKKDSLLVLIRHSKDDTVLVTSLNTLGREMMYNDPDTATILSAKALSASLRMRSSTSRSLKLFAEKGIASSYGNLGIYSWLRGNYPQAMDYSLKSLAVSEGISDKGGIAASVGNIGLIYSSENNYPEALRYYFKSLKMDEEQANRSGIAADMSNIGGVYKAQFDYDKALDYFLKTLSIDKELGDQNGIAADYCNIGNIYVDKSSFATALGYYEKALAIAEKQGNRNNISVFLGNIGIVYKEQNDFLRSLAFYRRAMEIDKELGNAEALSVNEGNVGALYLKIAESDSDAAKKQENYRMAEEFLKKSIGLCDSIGALSSGMSFAEYLSKLYTETGRHREAYEYFRRSITLKDSLFNDENTKKQTQTEMQYVFDKKTAADSVRNAEQAKQDELKRTEEVEQQRVYALGGGLSFLLMGIVALVSFRAFRHKQRSNELISEQKQLVEEKQKEIIASIRYAERIQKALLPSEMYIARQLQRMNKK